MNFSKTLKSVVFLIFATFAAAGFTATSQDLLPELEKQANPNFYDIKEAFHKKYEDTPLDERKGWKQYMRWESFWEPRVFPSGEFPDAMSVYAEYDKNYRPHKNESPKATYKWSLVGPETSPEGEVREQGLGRVNVVRFHPDNDNEIWAGSCAGGVWKSVNNGGTWTPFPFTQFLSIGASDIAFAPSDPDIVYVATGDADNGSYPRPGTLYSIGVIKTEDGGATWSVTGLQSELEDNFMVNRLWVHPTNPDIVVAATSRGIFKTEDGGVNWNQKTLTGNYRDMEKAPGANNTFYAATQGWGGNTEISRSTDLGDTWTEVLSLPQVSRIALAVTPDDPDFAVALCVTRYENSFHSIYATYDQGENWEMTANKSSVNNILGWHRGTGGDANKGQGQYDLALEIDPNDRDVIYVGGINIWKSVDGGFSFEMNSHWTGAFNKPYVHADIHDLAFRESTRDLFAGHDGGISYTSNGGNSWRDITESMSITQFYRLGVAQANPNIVIAGSQDNGTSMYKNGGWAHVRSSDGMEAAIDPTNSNIVYCSIYYGSLYRSTNGGSYFQSMLSSDDHGEDGAWITPYAIAPSNTKVLYAGYENVWKSNNYGIDWFKAFDQQTGSTFRSIAISPSDEDVVYAATYSRLYRTKDGGNSWDRIFTSNLAITYIAVHPTDPDKVWITFSGYSENTKVMEINLATGKEKNLTGNLPNVPANSIVYQKNSPDRLLVGTDIGVYYSDYGSDYWERYGEGMPNVIVSELEIYYGEPNILYAATHGRGLWKVELTDCNLPAPEIELQGETKLCDGDSLTIIAPDGYGEYKWMRYGEEYATGKTLTVKETGSYSLIVGDGAECTAKSEAVNVEAYEVRDMEIDSQQDRFSLCGDNDTLDLTATFAFVEYRWSNGETDRRTRIYEEGDVYVTGVTNEGCEAYSDTITIDRVYPDDFEIDRISNTLIAPEGEDYEWYLDGEKIPDESSRELEIPALGEYVVSMRDEFGCEVESLPLDVITGIEEKLVDADEFKIYPNPSEDIFYFENVELSGNVAIEVINSLGERVFSKTLEIAPGETIAIDMQNNPNGAYYAYVNAGGTRYSAILIKK